MSSSNPKPTVLLGFATHNDYFELLVEDKRTGVYTLLEGRLKPGQAEVVDYILPPEIWALAQPQRPDNTYYELLGRNVDDLNRDELMSAVKTLMYWHVLDRERKRARA